MQTTQRSVYTRVDANVGGYLESLPNDYNQNPTKKYPLLIFLHGVGERGDGSPGTLEKVANVGIARMLKSNKFPASFSSGGKNYSFIVISPQISGSSWDTPIESIIKYAKQHYRVDEQRVYLTGLSMGGVFSWIYASKTVERGKELAALLLVTPGAKATAAQLKNISSSQLPIWVTNNSGDLSNTAAGATALVNAINSTVPAPPKALLTIFNKAGHDAWTPTYDVTFKQGGLNVFEWMLSKSRGSAQPTTPKPVLTANAGANQVITLPANTATLNASGSKVTSGTITSYAWTKLSGPTSGTITLVSNGLQAKLAGLTAGIYTYQLTVKDSNGSTATATVTITVNAATVPPTANPGSAKTITLPTNSVTLDGSLSKASAGNTITSYKWVKHSGPSTGGTVTSWTSVKTTATGLVAGTYVFNLTVTDSRGASATSGVTVTVKPASSSTLPPTANPGSAKTITLPTNSVTLDGSLSKASTGNTITSYKWVKHSGPSTGGIVTSWTSVKTTATGLVAGTYVFNLTVTDSRGTSATSGVTVTVKAASSSTLPPTANPGSAKTITLPTNSVTLDGSLSKASTGNTITSYKWVKHSGPSTGGTVTSWTSVKTTATGLVAGTYVFNLTVTDSRGTSATSGVTVTVKPATASSAAPKAHAGFGGTITLPKNSFNLDGSLSTASSGNKIVSYKWSKRSGPAAGTITSPNSVKTTVTGLAEGFYIYDLTIVDSRGASSRAGMTITVYPAPSAKTQAHAGFGGVITLPVNSFRLNGSLSAAAIGAKIVSYKWTKRSGPAGGTILSSSSTITTVTGLTKGSYIFDLTIVDNKGVSSRAGVTILVLSSTVSARSIDTSAIENPDIAVVESSPSIITQNEQLTDFKVNISPNPVSSDMIISIKGDIQGKTSLIIYGLDGKAVMQQEFTKDGFGTLNRSFNLSRLPAGIYIVQIIVDGKYKKALRIVKQ